MVARGRRYFVGGAAALGMTALWPARPGHAATMGFDEARHLLSRAGFGATPAEIRAVAAMDYETAVDRLLGTSRGVIAVTLFRSRARLKKLLGASMGEES